jgi:large subunit ribosomal protein L5
MREIRIEKVTVSMGVGEAGEKLENAKTLLNRLTGKKAIETTARLRNPVFKIKKGDTIGAKITLRKKVAEEFLKKAIDAVDGKLKSNSFDREGNFSFGIKEYIDFPGAKYDPKIGILGFDVCTTLRRKGGRVSLRRRRMAKVGRKHRITVNEAQEFLKEKFGVSFV